MAIKLRGVLFGVWIALLAGEAAAQVSDEENGCILCHGNPDVWEKDTQHLFVTTADLAGDIHWQKGIKCQQCHGGNYETFNLREAHAIEDGFRTIESPADMPAFCGHCHSNAETMQGFQSSAKTDVVDHFWTSVHGQHLKHTGGEKAATCTSCHPKHQMRSTEDPASAVSPARLSETCGNCHTEQRTAMRKGVHHAAGPRDEQDAGTPLECAKCHLGDAHEMLPARDPESPVFLDHQVRVCGSCHEKYLTTYEASVHGFGLNRSGLLVTAVCSDCHGAHAMYYAADRRSTLHAANVAATCGKCHAFIEEALRASVHGQEGGAGSTGEPTAPGGKKKRKPSCTDCHQGHDLPHPDSALFHLELPARCGNCHADYASQYAMSLHGQLTQLGYEPAAKCSDCHGAHDILAISNSNSPVAPANRVQTCRQCHPYAVSNFAGFDPHANFKDGENYPFLHGLYVAIENLLYLLFLLFLLHAFLWFLRSLVQTLRFGRHERLEPEQPAIVRYAANHRILYGLLIVSFFGLAVTGLPLKYGGFEWARSLARWLGGFETTRIWHQFFAAVVVVVCAVHLVWIVRLVWAQRHRQGVTWKTLLVGPDSPVPNLRDLRDMLGMACWFIGLTRKPKFERWTYWEKFDYWGVYLAVLLIGGSGLVLWFPNLFALVLPGTVLNVAQMIHSATALMVGGCLFMIHFFNTHLRPEKFPLDMTVLTGLATETHLRAARPEFVARLEREGRLAELRALAPSHRALRWAMAAGFAAITIGMVLVGWMLFAYLGK